MFPFDYFASRALPPAFKTELGNGTPILVRHVRPEDAPRLKEGFNRLSHLARRRHFPGEEPTELTDEQLKLLSQVDGRNYVIWGAQNPRKPDEPGIGIARYRRLDEEPDAADVAITVMDPYQGTGAGLVLHACLHFTAHHNGIRAFYYDVSGENERFIRHLKHLGAEHVGRVVGVTRLKLPVFARAASVPQYSASGFKLARTMRRLAAAPAIAA
ncbi:MAG: GNAT family N-acetyltransferase [Gammaproteobacteria bacterium]|nr:GNAT family N-acetyltransferase [Gammaproteobacteria bacterium]